MPRNLDGTYTRPAGTTAVTGALITSELFNDAMDDLGQAITDSGLAVRAKDANGQLTSTGSGAAYSLTLSAPIASLANGLAVAFKAHAPSAAVTVTPTGTLTQGSATVANLSSAVGLTTGMAITGPTISVGFTGTLTYTSNQITGVSSTAGLAVGQPVTSVVGGVPAGTTITNISGSTVTMSAAFTGTTTGSAACVATAGINPGTTIAAVGATSLTLSSPYNGNTLSGANLSIAGASPSLTITNVGGGAVTKTLVAVDGSALRPNELLAGRVYTAYYDAARDQFVVADAVYRLRVDGNDALPGTLADKIVNSDGSPLSIINPGGNEKLSIPSPYKTGDFVMTARAVDASFVFCDGASYLQSAYPTLYAQIGQRYLRYNAASAATISGSVTTQISAVDYGGGLYVVFGADDNILTSADGLTFTSRRYSAGTTFWRAYAYGNSTHLVASAFSSGCATATSADGVTWTNRATIANTGAVTGLAFGAGTFVAVDGAGGVFTCATPAAGTGWVSRASGVSQLNAVAFGAGLFVAVGNGGVIITSPDGFTWTPRTSAIVGVTLSSVVYGNGLFVAGSTSGLQYSVDGITWTAMVFNPGTPSGFVWWDGYLWHGMASGSTEYVSPDFYYWLQLTGTSGGLRGVSGGAGVSVYTNGSQISRRAPAINVATQFCVPKITPGATTPERQYIKAS